jgi:PAS domain S-box-containing protein
MKNGNKTKGQPTEEWVAVLGRGEQSVTSLTKRYFAPIRLFIITIVSMFVAEAIIMLLLPILPPLPLYSEAILDAFFLTCLVFPMLYFFSFRPMILHITERKLTEEALRQSEAQKKAILDASIDCIALVDTEMRIVWANKTTAAIINKTPEDLIGHRCHKLFQHSDVPCPGCPCKKAFETGNIEHAMMYQPVMDTVGESYWEDYGVPVKDESGQVVGVIEICRDVTDKLKAEKALRESEEKLAGIVESVTDAMIMVDDNFNIAWTNDIAMGLFGTELVGKKCYIAFHGRNIICERCIVKKCFEDGRIHEFEMEIVGANGRSQRTFWCTASVAAWREDGRPKMVVEFLRDITERKRAEETLRESEQRSRDLVENSLTGIFIIQDDKIIYKNPEQERLFGHLPEPFKFTDFEGVHPDDVENFERFLQTVLSGDARTLDTEIRFYPAGKIDSGVDMRWVHCRASLIEYQGKDAILVNMMDITRTRTLEHLVLMEQKMVSLGHVAAGIAHEIRNPLSGINVYLTTLQKIYDGLDNFEPETKEKIKRIIEQLQSASGKIESVIKRVMDFSKPNVLKLALTDVNQSIEEAINLSSVTLRKSGIIIEKSLTPDLPQCYADPHLIEQVILNLITNAAEAMKKIGDPKKIAVTSYKETSSIIIKISDSGPGVPSNIRDKIFDPFFTTKSNSSGIGLSISHRIITDHGGSLDVSTSKWGGAEFRIKIPLEKRISPR